MPLLEENKFINAQAQANVKVSFKNITMGLVPLNDEHVKCSNCYHFFLLTG